MSEFLIDEPTGTRECAQCRLWRGKPHKMDCPLFGQLGSIRLGVPKRHAACLAAQSAASRLRRIESAARGAKELLGRPPTGHDYPPTVKERHTHEILRAALEGKDDADARKAPLLKAATVERMAEAIAEVRRRLAYTPGIEPELAILGGALADYVVVAGKATAGGACPKNWRRRRRRR